VKNPRVQDLTAPYTGKVMDRSAVIAWRSRWADVNDATTRESRAMSPEERLRTLARLRAFSASERIATWPEDEGEVWARFARLRALARARHADR
jgi:hypothetical protein